MFFFLLLICIFLDKSPLQVHSHALLYKKMSHKKRTSQSVSDRGSMTIEAAILLPLLLCAFMGLILWGKLFVLSQEMDAALAETARQISQKEHLYTQKDQEGSSISLAGPLFLVLKEQGDVSEELDITFLDFSGSKYMKDTGEIFLMVRYKVKLPLMLLGTWQISLESSVRQKAWNGYMPASNELVEAVGDYVYIAEDGEVYHKDSQCYHLHVTIKAVADVERYYKGNTKYDACEYCMDDDVAEDTLYITETGDCYHDDISCSGLTRRVRKIKLEQTEQRRSCKECT